VTALLWASPLLVVILLLASGRADTMTAGLTGVVLAFIVAMTPAAPLPLSFGAAANEIAKGLWLSWLAGSVIFGGLFFQQVLRAAGHGKAGAPVAADAGQRRRQLFAACFLIGPFAESATGFGIGYVIALVLLSRLELATLPLLVFGLFSQTLVPWGALAVGTVVGAHLSGLSTVELGFRSALLTIPLLAAWLLLFWRLAAQAGLRSTGAARVDDAAWLVAMAALLIVTNLTLDAEVAVVAAVGPLIALRFWRDMRPTAAGWRQAVRTAAPYAALSAVLIAARAIAPLRAVLTAHVVVQPPLAEAPAWPVLLHPALWLVVVAIAAAVAERHGNAVGPAIRETWHRGHKPLLATLLFLVMAQLLAGSGIARGLATALLNGLGPAAAVTISPLFAAIGGVLTGSTTGSNGLFMPSQVALGAAAGIDIAWLAAVQNTAASAATLLSPIRVAMGCALLGHAEFERPTYRAAWPLGVVPLALMMVAAAVLVWLRP
jgi:lactate permease